MLYEKQQTAMRAAQIGGLYLYGLNCLHQKRKEFIKKGYQVKGDKNSRQRIKPLDISYEPNPFMYQYDLEVDIFLNYEEYQKQELEIIRERMEDKVGEEREKDEEIINNILEHGVTGLPREEHFWNAAEIRWPTKTLDSGKLEGAFIRHPWVEKFIKATTTHEFIVMFGGSGQGKTHGPIAFMCIMWDHFSDTFYGARCCFSSINKDKLNSACWAYMQRLYNSGKKDVSLYAGNGIIAGDWTIKRAGNPRDTGGIIKGMLVGTDDKTSNRVKDKLTGSHVPTLMIYFIDEGQSTRAAPVEASPNFLQNPKHGWVFMSGNPSEHEDQLGRNSKPDGGWADVTADDDEWEADTITHQRARVIHYNNEYSPAITEPDGHIKWWFLPTDEKRDKRYRTPESKRSDKYIRFWLGWYRKDMEGEAIITWPNIIACRADTVPVFNNSFPITNGWSFDHAVFNRDRVILTRFCDGIERDTGLWICWIQECVEIEKRGADVDSIKNTCQSVLDYSRKWKVKSGNAIMDGNRDASGYYQMLTSMGFNCKPMVYNRRPPDGKFKNPDTNIIEPPIIVDAVTNEEAHKVCSNLIAVGAYTLQQLIFNGQIRGLNRDLCENFDDEICKRKFDIKIHSEYGERKQISSKKEFSSEMGFSPDILDTLFQMAYFMVKYRGMVPGTRDMKQKTMVQHDAVSDYHTDSRGHNNLDSMWNDEALSIL